jgi:hypothetical protein
MTRKNKMNKKSRNKQRKNRHKTKKIYKMKKIYGGEDIDPISQPTQQESNITQTVKPSRFQNAYSSFKTGVNKIGSKIEKGVESLKTGIENIGEKGKKGVDVIQNKTLKQIDIAEKIKEVPSNTLKSVSNVYSNLSGSENETEKQIRLNESEIEKLNKEKETADDPRKNEINELLLKLQQENESLKKESKIDVSKGLRNIGEGLGNFGKGLFQSFKPTKKIEFNNEEKTKIVEKLKIMEQKKELTEAELKYLIEYLNKPDILPSYNSVMSNVGKSLQGITESTKTEPTTSETTIIAAMVPNYYDNYNKNVIPSEKDNKITTEKDKMQEFKEFAFEIKTNRDYYSRARIIEELVNKAEELFNKKQNL